MPDRLCPFCGKPNPEDAEVCQHCQARLISPSNPLASSSDSAKQDLSDWLNSTRADAAKSTGMPTAKAGAPGGESRPDPTPDWLARIRERSRAEQEAENAGSSLFENPEPPSAKPVKSSSPKNQKNDNPEEKMPDEAWLDGLRDEKDSISVEDPEKGGEELPPAIPPAESEDWLKKLDGWQDTAEAHPGRVKDEHGVWIKPFHTSDLKELGEHPELEAPTHVPAKKLRADQEAPDQDWLEKTRQEAEKSEPPASIPPEEPIPDWLEELESSFPPPEPTMEKDIGRTKTGGAVPPGLIPPSESIPTPAEEMPEWLKRVEPGSPKKSKPSAPAFIPGHDEEAASPSQPPLKPSGRKTEGGEGLAPAQLPSWLQAMRPVESVLPENLPTGETSGEKGSGALAGLADVIPINEEATSVSKTSDSTPRLRVDDRQKVQAQLLESVVLEGSKAVEIPKTVQKKGRAAGRILTSLLITLLLAVPIVLGSKSSLTPAPAFFAPETVALFTGIQTLAPNSRVLVILDYQPSLSGELQTASLPVLEHLMRQSAGLAFISTTPSGPILANSLTQLAEAANPGFDPGQRFVNLGYLAGGAIGLQEFAQQPRYATPLTWTRFDAWSSPVLQAVSGLKDFNAVLILTESADTAKIWIEQVLPTIPQTPTYLVTSQQSAALLLPYYNSSQLKGMISGIVGGKMYELLLSKPGAVLPLWDSYQIGVILIFAVILFGGIFTSLPARPPKTAPVAKDEAS
jgi:hypothetical protein